MKGVGSGWNRQICLLHRWYWRQHKRRRHHHSHWQQRLRGLPRRWRRIAPVPCGHQRFCEPCANEVERTSGSWLSHLPHRHSDDPASFLTFTLCCVLWSVTFALNDLVIFGYALSYVLLLILCTSVWNRIHCVCNFHRMVCFCWLLMYSDFA